MSFELQKKTQSSGENLNKCILLPTITNRQTGMQMRLLSRRFGNTELQKPPNENSGSGEIEPLTERYCRGLKKPYTPFLPRSSTYYLPRIQIHFLEYC